MPKRSYPDDEIYQPIKKQQNERKQARNIISEKSEKTLQLLYQGARKKGKCVKEKNPNCACGLEMFITNTCFYCERSICQTCTEMCYKCEKNFCSSCSFKTYNKDEAVYCYTCYEH